MFSIKSSTSSREFRFTDRKGERFTVEIVGFGLTAELRSFAFGTGASLPQWMNDLASHRLPWEDVESWGSLDQDFVISATCSPSGLVFFKMQLWQHPGGQDEWRVLASVTSELGLLPGLAKAMDKFFQDETC